PGDSEPSRKNAPAPCVALSTWPAMTIDPAVAVTPGPYRYQPTRSMLGGTSKSPVRGSTPTGETAASSLRAGIRSRAGPRSAAAVGSAPSSIATLEAGGPDGEADDRAPTLGPPTSGG